MGGCVLKGVGCFVGLLAFAQGVTGILHLRDAFAVSLGCSGTSAIILEPYEYQYTDRHPPRTLDSDGTVAYHTTSYA